MDKGILYFSAPWCGPCKALSPQMEEIAKSGIPVRKINIDYDADLPQKYNVKNIPTSIVTDMNGNEHRLYDYLAQGYTVILDISATWCGPCWNYHSGGTFEEIWENHGPAGEPGVSANTTDDVMILWFEGDPGTALSELEYSNLGNWLNPNGAGEIQFPIINDDNIQNLYPILFAELWLVVVLM